MVTTGRAPRIFVTPIFLQELIPERYFSKEMQGKMIRFLVGRFSFRNRCTHSVTHGLSIFRFAPAQRLCQMPTGSRWHFIPSGFQCAGNFLKLRVICLLYTSPSPRDG